MYQLPEFVVRTGAKKVIEAGVTKTRRRRTFMSNCGARNAIAALWIKSGQIPARLLSASFFIPKESLTGMPFRVRVYEVDSATGGPGKDLLNTSVFVKVTHNDTWLEVNLDSFKIEVPARGIFVAMEWLYDKEKFHYRWKPEYQTKDTLYSCFGQRLGFIEHGKERITWHKTMGGKWVIPQPPVKVGHPLNAMIKVRLEVWE